MRLSRRQFLKSAAMTATGLSLGLGNSRPAFAWGEIGDPSVRGPIPTGGYKILEIFLYGGVSPWETFHVRSGILDLWFGLGTQVADLDWSATCTGIPPSSTQTALLGNDALGVVSWGPSTAPLWRSDIFTRIRQVVLRHNLEPHEAAIPYALTGHTLGRPNFSGLGAAISHRNANTAHPLPYSYVFIPQGGATIGDNFQGMHATGQHGGEHRPLVLLMSETIASVLDQLQRNGMTAQADGLLRFYRASYADRLRYNGTVTRSKGYAAYLTSLDNLLSAPTLRTLLASAPLLPSTDTVCAAFAPAPLPTGLNRTAASIRAAAYLLSQPESSGGARYVGVVDGGLLQAGGAGYDTHASNTLVTAVNVWNVCAALADVIDANSPPAAGKLSLNETLIVLKTEFGRTPEPNGEGRDHWPRGYVNVLIGGPITATTSRVAGIIEHDNTTTPSRRGWARDDAHFTPSEFHAALLLAAGIFPFESENFGIGDMGATKGATEEATATNIRTQVLGV